MTPRRRDLAYAKEHLEIWKGFLVERRGKIEEAEREVEKARTAYQEARTRALSCVSDEFNLEFPEEL